MNGDSEQDLQRAEWWLDCAKREKGGMGGEISHTADSGIALAWPQGAERTTDGGRPRAPDGTASVRQQGTRGDL